jgi:hypothetical protein
VDPHPVDADPDPTVNFSADPDPHYFTFLRNPPYQSDANPRQRSTDPRLHFEPSRLHCE